MLAKLFFDSVDRYPTHPALWVDGSFITYQTVAERAGRLATAISAMTSRREATGARLCGLLVNRSSTAFVGVLGALFAGATYVPLNSRFPTARLQSVLAASGLETVIVDRASMAAAEALLPSFPQPLTLIFPDETQPPDWAATAGHHRFVCRGDIETQDVAQPALGVGEDGAYLLFTSGSTGTPKGVLISHNNVEAYLRAILRRYEPTPEDRFTQLFDLSFDLSVHDMFVCWSAGACLFCPPASAVMSPRDFVRKHDLTFWFSVPSTVATMARLRMLGPEEFPSLRVSLFCGEALSSDLARKWRYAAPNSIIENLYGPTEATIAITAYRIPDDGLTAKAWPVVPIGLPFPGQQAVVIDADGKPLRDGEAGELCLGGSQVASGYWNAPQTTAERFASPLGVCRGEQRWYRTGDRVINDPQWGLRFLGRLDRQVKIRGFRIELQEVEAVAREAAAGETVAALPWPSGTVEPARHIVLFIAGEPTPIETIIAHCRAKLPAALVPRVVHFLASWPLNANGKTDYGALQQRLMGNHDKP